MYWSEYVQWTENKYLTSFVFAFNVLPVLYCQRYYIRERFTISIGEGKRISYSAYSA